MFRGEFVPSLYLKQLYSIAINLLTLKVSERDFKGLQRITWFIMLLQTNEKEKTQLQVLLKPNNAALVVFSASAVIMQGISSLGG